MTISLNRFSEIGSAAILSAFIKSSFPEDDDENDIFLQSGEEPYNLLFHNKWILESTLLTLALVYSWLPRFGHEWTKFKTVIIFITSLRPVLKHFFAEHFRVILEKAEINVPWI